MDIICQWIRYRGWIRNIEDDTKISFLPAQLENGVNIYQDMEICEKFLEKGWKFRPG